MTATARILADSITEAGHRLTTFEVVIHRFVLAEWNTHCVIDRNSASSRARPIRKVIEAIEKDLAYPARWQAEKPGMQAGESLGMADQEKAREIWRNSARAAVAHARLLLDLGVHKSTVNRILEPYLWHTIIATGTAWQNFFALRTDAAAQAEIRVVAEVMLARYQASTPVLLHPGEWHLPLVQDDERDAWPVEMLAQVSASRIARVSYLTHHGVRDVEGEGGDLDLYRKLTTSTPMHASPLGQVATPDPDNVHEVKVESLTAPGASKVLVLPRYGKLLGWHSLRHDVEVGRDYQSFS